MNTMTYTPKPEHEYAGQFVVDGHPIGDYLEVTLPGEPTCFDTVYPPEWVKRKEQIPIMSWPMRIHLSCNKDIFDVDFHVGPKSQNKLMERYLEQELLNILYKFKAHFWFAPRINGHGLNL